MPRLVTATLLAGALALPLRPAVAQQQATVDTIRWEAAKFIQAIASKDIDRFVALFAPEPDFIYVDGGRIYPDRAALRNAGSGFFSRIASFDATWTETKILTIGTDAAVFTGVMKIQGTTSAGQPIWPNGKIWTLAYQRRAGHWMIVQAHEATVPPPRPPQ